MDPMSKSLPYSQRLLSHRLLYTLIILAIMFPYGATIPRVLNHARHTIDKNLKKQNVALRYQPLIYYKVGSYEL